MSLTSEQEEIYQHAITSLIQKVDKRDEEIMQLRKEVARLKTNKNEEGCNGLEGNNH
jgi:hypothetical protein